MSGCCIYQSLFPAQSSALWWGYSCASSAPLLAPQLAQSYYGIYSFLPIIELVCDKKRNAISQRIDPRFHPGLRSLFQLDVLLKENPVHFSRLRSANFPVKPFPSDLSVSHFVPDKSSVTPGMAFSIKMCSFAKQISLPNPPTLGT